MKDTVIRVCVVVLGVELSRSVFKGEHRCECIISQVDPEFSERIVARVQIEPLVGPQSLVAHAWREAGNSDEDIRVIFISSLQSTLTVNVLNSRFITVSR